MLYSSCAGIVLTYAPLNNVYGKICALPWIDRIQKFLTKINSHFDLYSKYFTLKMQSLLSYLFYHRAKILYYCIVCNSCKKKKKISRNCSYHANFWTWDVKYICAKKITNKNVLRFCQLSHIQKTTMQSHPHV